MNDNVRPNTDTIPLAPSEPPEFSDQMREVNIELRASLARAAIQAYLLLNGGAAVALLAFLGNLATAPENTRLAADLALLKFALMVFNTGVALAATSYWVGYQVYTDYINYPDGTRGEGLRKFAVALNVVALVMFVVGIVTCGEAITAR